MNFTLIVVIISVLIVVGICVVYLSNDKVGKLKDSLHLQKAAMLYASNFNQIMGTLWSVHRSIFSIAEPIIWVYRTEGKDDVLLGSFRKHLRVWVQPENELENTHIVLDAMKNNTFFTNLVRFKFPKQSIKLEGDFPSYFKLYCRPEQQIIALQIIAPDVMAFIVDNAMEVDIEIVDHQIALIYKNGAKDEASIRLAMDLMGKMTTLRRAVQKVTTI